MAVPQQPKKETNATPSAAAQTPLGGHRTIADLEEKAPETFFHRNRRTIMAGLLAVTMVTFGFGGILTQYIYQAKMNQMAGREFMMGKEVSIEKKHEWLEQRRTLIGLRLGDRSSNDIPERMLEQDFRAYQEALALGIGVSDAEVSEAIKSQQLDGSNAPIAAQTLKDAVASEKILDRYRALMILNYAPVVHQVEMRETEQSLEAAFQIAAIDASKIRETLAVSQKELVQEFNEQKDRANAKRHLMGEEQYYLDALILPYEAFTADLKRGEQYTEYDLQKYYDGHKASFGYEKKVEPKEATKTTDEKTPDDVDKKSGTETAADAKTETLDKTSSAAEALKSDAKTDAKTESKTPAEKVYRSWTELSPIEQDPIEREYKTDRLKNPVPSDKINQVARKILHSYDVDVKDPAASWEALLKDKELIAMGVQSRHIEGQKLDEVKKQLGLMGDKEKEKEAAARLEAKKKMGMPADEKDKEDLTLSLSKDDLNRIRYKVTSNRRVYYRLTQIYAPLKNIQDKEVNLFLTDAIRDKKMDAYLKSLAADLAVAVEKGVEGKVTPQEKQEAFKAAAEAFAKEKGVPVKVVSTRRLPLPSISPTDLDLGSLYLSPVELMDLGRTRNGYKLSSGKPLLFNQGAWIAWMTEVKSPTREEFLETLNRQRSSYVFEYVAVPRDKAKAEAAALVTDAEVQARYDDMKKKYETDQKVPTSNYLEGEASYSGWVLNVDRAAVIGDVVLDAADVARRQAANPALDKAVVEAEQLNALAEERSVKLLGEAAGFLETAKQDDFARFCKLNAIQTTAFEKVVAADVKKQVEPLVNPVEGWAAPLESSLIAAARNLPTVVAFPRGKRGPVRVWIGGYTPRKIKTMDQVAGDLRSELAASKELEGVKKKVADLLPSFTGKDFAAAAAAAGLTVEKAAAPWPYTQPNPVSPFSMEDRRKLFDLKSGELAGPVTLNKGQADKETYGIARLASVENDNQAADLSAAMLSSYRAEGERWGGDIYRWTEAWKNSLSRQEQKYAPKPVDRSDGEDHTPIMPIQNLDF